MIGEIDAALVANVIATSGCDDTVGRLTLAVTCDGATVRSERT